MRQKTKAQSTPMRSSLYAFDCRGSGPYPRHENPDDSNLSASRLASILLTIPGSLAASAASVKATTHETLPPSGAVTVTVAKMGLPSLSAVATTALPPSRRTRPCINSRRRVRPVAIVLYDTACRFGPGAAQYVLRVVIATFLPKSVAMQITSDPARTLPSESVVLTRADGSVLPETGRADHSFGSDGNGRRVVWPSDDAPDCPVPPPGDMPKAASALSRRAGGPQEGPFRHQCLLV